MKFLLLSVLSVLLLANVQAQPEFVWANHMGGTSTTCYCYGVAVDNAGNVYSVGNFWGTVDFDPGAGVYPLTSTGNDDVFVSKTDASGQLVWAFHVGGSSADYGYGICTDDHGNFYITGVFYSTVDFDPGAGSYPLTSSGGWDIFVAKYTDDGNLVWAKKMGGTASDYGYAIAVDTMGSVYSCGWFGGTADFDPGTSAATLTTAGGDDIFISKLDSSGNYKWARRMGGSGSDRANSIATDKAGNVYAGGYYNGTADFNPGGAGFQMTSNGLSDVYACKLDSGGVFKWASGIGGLATDWCYGIDADSIGNVFITGTFSDSADFDPGPAIQKLISNGSMDIFVGKLDSMGQLVWAANMGSASDDMGRSVKVDKLGFVHSTGYFSGTADFDPGAAEFDLISNGGYDVYASTLDSAGAFLCAGGMGGAGSTDYGMAMALDNSGFSYYAGSYSGNADFDPESTTYNLAASGTTDAFVVKLIACAPCMPTACDTTMSVCSGMVSPSGNYIWTTNGTYTDTIFNAHQCDSVITFHLTITQNTYGTINPVVCDNYTVPSGNYTYYANGTYHDTIPNAAGCDSILTINLSIVPPDTSVGQTGNTLTALASPAMYQWVDCNNAFMTIPGETAQSFTPTQSGSYAVVVYQNGCFEMSDCFQVTISSVMENEKPSQLNIFPNPSNGLFSFENKGEAAVPYEITDAAGKVVQRGVLQNGSGFIDLQDFENGIYILKTQQHEMQLIKQQ
ncbi:hypothetical protein SDC9_61645 [bioreactor metagenome]|uniref:Secretion system C-terminal sorting domain-containing protein n=1 Tax=bioreactor metagenome TaxID=1076179 RepID=A0A644XH49_9ZZZZ